MLCHSWVIPLWSSSVYCQQCQSLVRVGWKDRRNVCTSKHSCCTNSTHASLNSLCKYSLFFSLSFVQHSSKQGNHRLTPAQGTLISYSVYEKKYSKSMCINMQQNADTKLQSTGDIFFLRNSFGRKNVSPIMPFSHLLFFILACFSAA